MAPCMHSQSVASAIDAGTVTQRQPNSQQTAAPSPGTSVPVQIADAKVMHSELQDCADVLVCDAAMNSKRQHGPAHTLLVLPATTGTRFCGHVRWQRTRCTICHFQLACLSCVCARAHRRHITLSERRASALSSPSSAIVPARESMVSGDGNEHQLYTAAGVRSDLMLQDVHHTQMPTAAKMVVVVLHSTLT